MFLFRNVFGEWCQKELDNFKTSVECYRKCKSILLGPGKIKSPIETSLVTVFVKNTDMIYATIKNHRYKCKAFKNCDQTSCLNGGKCIESGRNVKCSCPYYSTGSFCEQIIDTCYSNPCLNGGECSAKPFKNPVCTCTPDFHGKFCEKEVVHCKFNPCKNGGKCKTQINKQVECLCPKEFKGTFCDVPTFDLCKNRLIGENIPHPEDNKLFLVCLHDGQYKISPCPIGLVFNQYKGRCDYDNKEQILKQHPCESNINNCKNNAKCIPIDDNDKYICECQSGFNGTFCENNVINDCDNQCGLNGQCIDLVNDYICMCENGLYGKDCHTNMVKIPCVGKTENTTRHSYPFDQSIIIECDHNGRLSVKKCPSNLVWDSHRAICTYPPERPNIGLLGIKCLKKDCQNNGKCIIDEDNNARCQCQKGFEGDLCEINIDECASNPCMNNGKCVDGINSYYCVCENKFLDKDCCCLDAINPCHNVLNEFHLKKDRTVRYTHPFSNEKFIVCNLEGFAQVLDCPEGLVWKEDEQTCALKNDNINEIYTGICTNGRKDLVLPYPYSGLKYAVCLEEGYKLQECEKKNPYFCEKNSKCVKDFKKECKNVRF